LSRSGCSNSAHVKKCSAAQSLEKVLFASQPVILAFVRKAVSSSDS